MNDRFRFRIPMFTDKGTFMEFQYLELGDFIECTLCGTNGKPQQCTGLKDKNGKLIYEGDILKLAEFGKPVEVKHRALGFVLRREPSNTVGYDNDKYIPEDCEVIGNIYENHKLLEAE